jgi:hypothetical protein
MRNKTILRAILVVFIFSGTMFAQEMEKKKIELPKLTLEQKWNRAELNFMSTIVGSIGYIKSLGKTAGDYGKALGEFVAPSWKGGIGKGVSYFIQGMYRNWQIFKNFQMEILDESESSFKAKIKGVGESYIESGSEIGATKDDLYDCWNGVLKEIADYLGLIYEQKIEGDWIVFTVTEKK